MKLRIEVIPQSLWGINLREKIGRSKWDKVRKECAEKANHRCEICGDIGPEHPVECHEIWDYDDQNHIQKLVGLISLCPLCHEVKHYGRSCNIGRANEVQAHFLKINNCTPEEMRTHITQEGILWKQRSKYKWEQDLSWFRQGKAKTSQLPEMLPIFKIDNSKRRVVFDLETKPLSKKFKAAWTLAERRESAPRPILACAYIINEDKYLVFKKENLPELLQILKSADEIITYNGERFDFLVLERFWKATRSKFIKGESVDLMKLTQKNTGRMVSLDKMAKLNLKKRKELSGSELAHASEAQLESVCMTDVKLTHELYKLSIQGKLKFPKRSS